MSTIIKQSTIFPHLHGKGLEINKDFMEMYANNRIQNFKNKYDDALGDIMFNNFLAPLLEASNRKESIEELGKALANKKSLFLAAFI